MGWIIQHPRLGVLTDFDPFGKQEIAWAPDSGWVFSNLQQAKIVRLYLPRYIEREAEIVLYDQAIRRSRVSPSKVRLVLECRGDLQFGCH